MAAKRKRLAPEDLRVGMIVGDMDNKKARWEILRLEGDKVRVKLLCWHDGTPYVPGDESDGTQDERFAATDPWFEDTEYRRRPIKAQLKDAADYYAAVTEGVGDV